MLVHLQALIKCDSEQITSVVMFHILVNHMYHFATLPDPHVSSLASLDRRRLRTNHFAGAFPLSYEHLSSLLFHRLKLIIEYYRYAFFQWMTTAIDAWLVFFIYFAYLSELVLENEGYSFIVHDGGHGSRSLCDGSDGGIRWRVSLAVPLSTVLLFIDAMVYGFPFP